MVKVYHATFLFALLIIWLWYLLYTKRLGKLPIIVSLATFSFLFYYLPQISETSTSLEQGDTVVTGKITSPIDITPSILQFDLQDYHSENVLKVTLFDPTERSNMNYGAICQIKGKLSIPEASTNPGQFNYQHYLATNGIRYVLEVETLSDMECTGKSPLNFLYSIREYAKNTVASSYTEKTSMWINALVLGDDSQIPEEIANLFSRWGISHVLAISGLHIGFIIGLFYFVTVRCNWLTKEKAQNLLLLFLPIYAVMAGGEPSVWRACLMGLSVILLQKWKTKLSIIDSISLTFLLLVIVDKYIIYQIGFQFSFIVTFAILLSRRWLASDKSLFFQMVKISLLAQLIILPLQMIYFFSFNPLAILFNVFAVPYFTFFVIPLMFVLLLLSKVPVISTFLDWFFSHIHQDLFIQPLEFIDQVCYFPWETGEFPILFVAIYYGVLLIFMICLSQGKKWQAFLTGILLSVTVLFVLLRPYLSPYGSVTILDIGQGDAFVIELPYRKGVFLLDAGAKFSFESNEPSDANYSNVIKPFLQYKGIQHIDALILSHEDIDHAGSSEYILQDFAVDSIIISDFFQIKEGLRRDLEEQRVEVIRVKAGQSLDMKGKKFNILSPRVDKKVTNKNALVMATVFGNETWLFTGDIDKEIEREILQNYPSLHVDTLKIAHHGSKTSSDPAFINSIHPSTAIISVGKNNRYGHPSQEVITLLKDENLNLYRTDKIGAVIYRFTERNGTFYQFKP